MTPQAMTEFVSPPKMSTSIKAGRARPGAITSWKSLFSPVIMFHHLTGAELRKPLILVNCARLLPPATNFLCLKLKLLPVPQWELGSLCQSRQHVGKTGRGSFWVRLKFQQFTLSEKISPNCVSLLSWKRTRRSCWRSLSNKVFCTRCPFLA